MKINININVKEFNGKTVNQKLVKLWMDVFGLPYMKAVQVATLSDEDYKQLLKGMIEQWKEKIKHMNMKLTEKQLKILTLKNCWKSSIKHLKKDAEINHWKKIIRDKEKDDKWDQI